uniref:Uncharacterized protein n=1 Tax=Caulobacter phage BL57 TaxID=3348355 RepID=A0AB74UKA7_9VIRU
MKAFEFSYTGGSSHEDFNPLLARSARDPSKYKNETVQQRFVGWRSGWRYLICELQGHHEAKPTATPSSEFAPPGATGEDLYRRYVNGANIHSNRFPSWGELTPETQRLWTEAALAGKSQP